MELHELLELANAPDEIVRWAREDLLDFDTAWERCRRSDHRLWLAAVAGAPIEDVIDAAAAVVMTVEAQVGGVPAVVGDALTMAVEGARQRQLSAAAKACEHIADGGMADYRSGAGPSVEALASATALVVRAAEALMAGEARREAVRLEQARAVGANLGIGMQSVLPQGDGPARLSVLAAASDPAQGSFLFCVAACAQAVLLMKTVDAMPTDELDDVVSETLAFRNE